MLRGLSPRFWITFAIFLVIGASLTLYLSWLYNRQLSTTEIAKVFDRYRLELGALAVTLPSESSGSREHEVVLSRINQFLLEKEIFDKVEVYGPDGKLVAHREFREVQKLDPGAPEGIGVKVGESTRLESGKSTLPVTVPLAAGGAIKAELNEQLLADKAQALRTRLRQSFALGGGVSLALLISLFIITLILTEKLHREGQARLAAEEMSALGQLAAGLAHEIKNPLNAISLNLQLLEEELPPAQRAGEPQALLKAMRGEIGRLDSLARDFLLYAKPLPLKRNRVALEPVLRELRRLLLPQADQRRVQLELNVDPGLQAAADEGLLRQAVLNLLLNAIHFSPPGGTVTLEATGDGDRVKIRVMDQGPGVGPELREKIFAPFFSTREGGTGLGLAIAKRIATAHGGSLKIAQSNGAEPEKWEGFLIELPADARESERNQGPQ